MHFKVPSVMCRLFCSSFNDLTHWVSNLTIIGSDNGLSPGRHQAIIWTNAGILIIQTLRTNLTEILSEIHTFSFKKMHFKVPSVMCRLFCSSFNDLTHWVSNLTIIGSDNGLSPGRHQAIIWTNAGILIIQTLRTNLTEILSEIHTFSFKKMHLKMLSAKWRPFCLSLNVSMWGVDGHWYHSVGSNTLSACQSVCQSWWIWCDSVDEWLEPTALNTLGFSYH